MLKVDNLILLNKKKLLLSLNWRKQNKILKKINQLILWLLKTYIYI